MAICNKKITAAVCDLHSIMNQILTFIDKFRRMTFLQIFTIYVRYLIGGAFVIAAFGMGKFNNSELLISSPGASIEKLEPIQQFFRVMATSGLYWHFIGWSQVIGGALLMTQRFAKLGALIFFGLILNIFIITVSYHFQGTPVVTGLMLLATTYLLVWDLDSFQFIFRKADWKNFYEAEPLVVIEHSFWSIVGLVMFVSIVVLYYSGFNIIYQLGTCFLEGLVGFTYFFTVVRRPKAKLAA